MDKYDDKDDKEEKDKKFNTNSSNKPDGDVSDSCQKNKIFCIFYFQ